MSTNISAKEAERIAGKLERLAFDFLAIHTLCRQDWDKDIEHVINAVETISKAGVRTCDACITRLGGTPMGNFANEFEDEEEVTNGH